MILVIELLLLLMLGMIMATLIIDESSRRRRAKHLVLLKGYWDGKERRRVERHNVTLDVAYKINHSLKDSKARDISLHGIGLVLDEKLERKTPLALEIKINGLKNPIRAKARVMWSRESAEDGKYSSKRLFNTGIKFVSFANPSQEKRLFDYIRSIEKNMD